MIVWETFDNKVYYVDHIDIAVPPIRKNYRTIYKIKDALPAYPIRKEGYTIG